MLSIWLMPQLHSSQDAAQAFCQNQLSQFERNERNNTSEEDSIVCRHRIFRLFNSVPFFRLLNILSNCHFQFHSLCPGKLCSVWVQFWFLLGSSNHSDKLLIAKHTRSLLDSLSSKSVLLKTSALVICSPVVYFNSSSKPIKTTAHLLILADAVFGISLSGVKKSLSDLKSLGRVNRLPRKILLTLWPKRHLSVLHAPCVIFFAPLESISSRYFLLVVLFAKTHQLLLQIHQ